MFAPISKSMFSSTSTSTSTSTLMFAPTSTSMFSPKSTTSMFAPTSTSNQTTLMFAPTSTSMFSPKSTTSMFAPTSTSNQTTLIFAPTSTSMFAATSTSNKISTTTIYDKYNLYLLKDPKFEPSYKNIIYVVRYEDEPEQTYTVPDNKVLKIITYPKGFVFIKYKDIRDNMEKLFNTYIQLISTDYINRRLTELCKEETTMDMIFRKTNTTFGNLPGQPFNILNLCYLSQTDSAKYNAYSYASYLAFRNNQSDSELFIYKYYNYNNENYFILMPRYFNIDNIFDNEMIDIESINDITNNDKVYKIKLENIIFDQLRFKMRNKMDINVLKENITKNFDKLVRLAELSFIMGILIWYKIIWGGDNNNQLYTIADIEMGNIRNTINDDDIRDLTM
jgi:hypothetical protein